MKKVPVGNCFNCKKPAQWNEPGLTWITSNPDDNRRLWCCGCIKADRSGIVFRLIEQLCDPVKEDLQKYTFTGGVAFNGVIVWKDCSTWIQGGSRSVKLTEEEKKLSPIEIARLINEEHNVQGLTRCTGCGTKMTKDQIAGYPLFSGVCCAPCMKKHGEHLQEQKLRGHVCGMCGKPYDACYC